METYFTIEGIARYLGYAEKTIRKWVLNRAIPFHKIHNTIRFRLSEIEKWVDRDGTHEPSAENGEFEGGLFNGPEHEEVADNGEPAEAGAIND